MKITFQKGRRAGESLTFTPPGVFIGRESDNDIQLLADGISQYHAKMIFTDGTWILHDLESSNGTKINGRNVKEPTPLKSGDMIYIATEALKIEFDQEKEKGEEETKTEDSDNSFIDKNEPIKLRSPEEMRKKPTKKEEPEYSTSTEEDIDKPHKKSKEEKAQEREIRLLVQEALKEKKKRLTIISIIIAIVANALIFFWWFSKIKS